MIRTAAQVVHSIPRLSHFTIRHAVKWGRLCVEDIQFKQIGTYEVISDDHGVPISLKVHEAGVGRRGQRFSRHYTHLLFPNLAQMVRSRR